MGNINKLKVNFSYLEAKPNGIQVNGGVFVRETLSEGIDLDLLSLGQGCRSILLLDALDSNVGKGTGHVFIGDLHAEIE